MGNDERAVGNAAAKVSAAGGMVEGMAEGSREPVRILALETSGREASAALLEASGGEARLVREIALGGSQRTAQMLMPAVRDLLEATGWTPTDVRLVAVAVGPGSFTGLRIGVTMAKTFAYAVGAEVIAVHTLAVLAEQAGVESRPLWTVMDAQRQELFAARFDQAAVASDSVTTRVISESDWLGELRAGDSVTGPVLKKLQSRLPEGVRIVEEARWQPMAATVGVVGWREYRAGRRDDLWKLVPQYYRLSAAEEKRGRQGDKETRS
jgi:tRNA threonylcarbamoyladenosine biosynthesis protein TsaB